MINWIRGFVLGALKQSPLSLDSYSMVDILDAYYGHKMGQQVGERVHWETARFISFVSFKAAGNKRMKSPTDLIKFEWENISTAKGTKGNGWSREELQKLKEEKPNWFK